MVDPNPRLRMLEKAVSEYQEEMKDAGQVWRDIDSKSQGLAAACMAVLGGLLYLARVDPRPSLVLDAALLLTLSTIAFVLRTLLVRTVMLPRRGHTFFTLAEHLLSNCPDEIAERQEAFLHDQVKIWRSGAQDLSERGRKKARTLRYAQLLFFFVLLALAVQCLLVPFVEQNPVNRT